ncbi:folate-binding protein [Ectothiorhodospiraceae bacterium BW-2]|nr:folate-binding protein [Ectothiorhodospiraceae bacterium BW-2]
MADWQPFLSSHPAVSMGELAHFSGSESPLWVDLSHLQLWQLQGGDTELFLQGQLSSNVQSLGPDLSQLSSYSTPKGRMLAMMRLLRTPDGSVWMLLPDSIAAATLKRLQMFVLRSEVKFSDYSDHRVRLGLNGEAAATLLQRHFGTLPEEENGVAQFDKTQLLRLPFAPHRYLLITTAEQALALMQQPDAANLPRAEREAWEWLDISAGLPSLDAATVEAFVPQMANLQLLGGVSFKKGCYTGQEVVARMQYLGKLKRKMYRLHSESAQCPTIGSELNSPHSKSGQWVGKVVNAAPAPQGGVDLLAVVEIAAMEQGGVTLVEGGSEVTLLPLPY